MIDKKLKILMIDDEPDFIEPMAYWLRAKGYDVVVEEDAEHALAGIKDDPPDAVLLDIVMPQKSGLAVLKQIREISRSLPVIIMTSFIKDSRADQASDDHMISGVFFKGDDFSVVLQLITDALKKSA